MLNVSNKGRKGKTHGETWAEFDALLPSKGLWVRKARSKSRGALDSWFKVMEMDLHWR